jgi:hypothetical protein
MRRIAGIVLIAIGIGGGVFIASKRLCPVMGVCFDHELITSDLALDLISGWHFKRPLYRKPCFGFCPELERIP